MSRLPPVPPAALPTHGPDAVPKTSVDISHRVRHQMQRAARETAERDQSPAGSSLVTLIAGGLALGVLAYFATSKSRALK